MNILCIKTAVDTMLNKCRGSNVARARRNKEVESPVGNTSKSRINVCIAGMTRARTMVVKAVPGNVLG